MTDRTRNKLYGRAAALIGGESERDKREIETKRYSEREQRRIVRHTASSRPRD